MIKGPVTCRRGIILLETEHFERLGGEVDSLLIKNAQENIFARALNLPENPDPYNDKNEDGQRNVQDEVDEMFDEDFDIDMEAITEIEERPTATNNQRNNEKSKETKMTKKNSIQGTKMMTQVGGRRSEALGLLPVCFERTVEDEVADFPDGDDNDFMEIANATNDVDLNDDYNQIDELPSSSVTADFNPRSNSTFKTSKNQVDNDQGDSWDVATSGATLNDCEFGNADESDSHDLLTQDVIERTLGNFSGVVTTNYSSNSPVDNRKNPKPDYPRNLNDNKTIGSVKNIDLQASKATHVPSTVKEFKVIKIIFFFHCEISVFMFFNFCCI